MTTTPSSAAVEPSDEQVREAFRAYDARVTSVRYQTPWEIWRDAVVWCAALTPQPIPQPPAEASQRPYAYAVIIAAESRIELVHDLEDVVEELTNCECEVMPLYDHPQPPPEASPTLKDDLPPLPYFSKEIDDILTEPQVFELRAWARDFARQAVAARAIEAAQKIGNKP